MPITVSQGLQAMLSGEQGENPFVQAVAQRKLQEYLKGKMVPEQTKTVPGQDVELPGPTQDQRPLMGRTPDQQVTTPAHYQPGVEDASKINLEQQRETRAKDMLNDPSIRDLVNNGGAYSVDPATGAVHIGGSPYAKMAAQGPHQAQAFLKQAQGAYKGINDQLDASQATLDALNQGNATSDKLALINEARLAAGAGGSRAISHMVDILSGGQTAASDFQGKLNWLQNTPNVPTLQPAMRDAIRESVFNRIPQLEQLHHQVSNQLSQQGPILAPQADTGTLLNSFVSPAQQKLDSLKRMQADYSSARSKMQGADISQPANANPNPTTFDRLKNAFGALMGNQQQQAPQSGLEGYLKGGQASSPQGPSYGAHPQDNEAIQWARANPSKPQAQQILKMNGVQ